MIANATIADQDRRLRRHKIKFDRVVDYFLTKMSKKLPGEDSNLERGYQKPLCYHYTTGYHVNYI